MAEGGNALEEAGHAEFVAELRGFVEHRFQTAAVGRLGPRRQGTRILEQDAGADRPRPEQLTAGERGCEVAIGLLPAAEQGRELPQTERDGTERLLGIGDGVVVGVWEQELIELEGAPLVADEDTGLGQGAQVEDPDAVAGKVREVPSGMTLELAACQLLVAELGGGEGVPPAGNPGEPLGVVPDPGQELGEAALCPPDCEHLPVAEHVGRELALP